MEKFKANLKNKKIMITGGTGSFGNALVKKLIKFETGDIIIFSRDEKKQDDMRKYYNNTKLKFFLGDIRDSNSVYDAMDNIDYIFHAAALKQVPSCEFFPLEAVKTNIMGTQNVLDAVLRKKVSKCVFLSTDKAVQPINSMGLSKALMEKIVVASSRINKNSNLIITRYGNVIGSRGSVVPLFIEQIKNNLDVTITDPKMSRFMMTLEEAVDLVIFAFINGVNGDIFVKKSPSTYIGNIIEALKIIMNKKNVNSKIIGVRHSEKMHETLLSYEEINKCVELHEYFKIPLDDRDLNYNLYYNQGKNLQCERQNYSSSNTKLLTIDELVELFKNDDFLKVYF